MTQRTDVRLRLSISSGARAHGTVERPTSRRNNMSAKNKEIIQKVNAAFEANQPETFLDFCAEDITWHMAGDEPRTGKQSIRDFMASMGDMEPPKINVTAMIAEGESAACYGDMTMKEKGTENTYDYCDIYRFKGDKIAELRSFVTKHKAAGEKTATA
jgi:ketosteroid isomerase-like protein